MRAEECRPLQGAAPTNLTRSSVLSIADIYALTRQHRYGVLVVTERRDGTIVSQTYSNLQAAGRKLDRVRERGLIARAVLVELRAVADADVLGGDSA